MKFRIMQWSEIGYSMKAFAFMQAIINFSTKHDDLLAISSEIKEQQYAYLKDAL